MFWKNKEYQEKKLDLLIESGYKNLKLHNRIYDALNKKIMWFFTFVSAIEGYLLVHFFLSKDFLIYNIYIKFLFFLIIILGLYILGRYIYLLRLKTFHTGPDITKQTKNFWKKEKDLFGLKFDTLGTLNDSYYKNNDLITDIGKGFNFTLYFLGIYFILIIFYFLTITIMAEEELPIVSENTGSQQYNEPPLHSENTGKVDKTYNPKK